MKKRFPFGNVSHQKSSFGERGEAEVHANASQEIRRKLLQSARAWRSLLAMAWLGPYLRRQAAAGTTFASRCAAQRCSQDLAACATFGRTFASQGDGSSHDEVTLFAPPTPTHMFLFFWLFSVLPDSLKLTRVEPRTSSRSTRCRGSGAL